MMIVIRVILLLIISRFEAVADERTFVYKRCEQSLQLKTASHGAKLQTLGARLPLRLVKQLIIAASCQVSKLTLGSQYTHDNTNSAVND